MYKNHKSTTTSPAFLLSAILLLLLLQLNRPAAQWVRRPRWPGPSQMCASQFTLANTACSHLPFRPPHLPFTGGHHHHRRHRHHGHDHQDQYRAEDQVLVQHPLDEDEDEEHRQRHRHGRHHHHHGRTAESHAERECCRWVSEVDDGCVCDLLLNMPVFMVRPIHRFTVVVDDGCNVTYACGSRFVEL